ncbi:transport protein [Acrocarpospora phusangensis]|uniref:Transport protein n=1 Tax=Acrocarpospora phusangensis TaxID=1070424 RepID=A0A919QAG3_9ACTN|nr:MIP/aquaporin family protein [Acrocarpospora phusangensis]GIH25327.1 transport protein [Acrocarpospora phusangensis]
MSRLGRRLLAEFVGTALLVAVVVGSGIMAQNLAPGQIGLQLLANSTATVFGLAVLILILGPVSGAHFNPVVSLADWWQARQRGTGLSSRELGGYVLAQALGAIGGCLLANAMFAVPAISWSSTERTGAAVWLGEIVATAGLILVIFALTRTGRAAAAPVAVAAYIGAAYWFTSSTSFANPAVTLGRAFSDTFAGIAPISVPGFVLAQLAGGVIGFLLVQGLFGRPGADVPEAVSGEPTASR